MMKTFRVSWGSALFRVRFEGDGIDFMGGSSKLKRINIRFLIPKSSDEAVRSGRPHQSSARQRHETLLKK
ncbi:MAG: hypothetical protein Q7K57_30450 [Burkholderiaceae bacterium]|nr:hypothetical protein [Burkholderiaceae bacterium]